MRKLFALLAMLGIGISAQAYEVALSTTNTMILPAVSTARIATYTARAGATAYALGETLKYGTVACIVVGTGTTANVSITNSVTTTNTSKYVVTGTLSPSSATGTYYRCANYNWNPAFTNTTGGFALSFSQGTYRITTNTLIGTSATTNCWIKNALLGQYIPTNSYTGTATVSPVVETVDVVSYVVPTINATGVTVDGTATVMRIPTSRLSLYLSVLSNDAVFQNAAGDKIYKSVGLLDMGNYQGPIYGSSTNLATVEIFPY